MAALFHRELHSGLQRLATAYWIHIKKRQKKSKEKEGSHFLSSFPAPQPATIPQSLCFPFNCFIPSHLLPSLAFACSSPTTVAHWQSGHTLHISVFAVYSLSFTRSNLYSPVSPFFSLWDPLNDSLPERLLLSLLSLHKFKWFTFLAPPPPPLCGYHHLSSATPFMLVPFKWSCLPALHRAGAECMANVRNYYKEAWLCCSLISGTTSSPCFTPSPVQSPTRPLAPKSFCKPPLGGDILILYAVFISFLLPVLPHHFWG